MNTIEDPKTFFLKVLNFIILISFFVFTVIGFFLSLSSFSELDFGLIFIPLVIIPLLLFTIGFNLFKGLKEVFKEKVANPLPIRLLVFCFLSLYLLNAFNDNLINNYDEWVEFTASLYGLFSIGFVSSCYYKQNKLVPYVVSLVILVAIYFLGMKEKFENRYEGWSIVQVTDNEEYLQKEYSELSVDENLYWGLNYEKGYSIPANDIKAFNHLLMAAKQGNHLAMWIVSSHYSTGKGVNQDLFKSFAWLNAFIYDSRHNEQDYRKEFIISDNGNDRLKITYITFAELDEQTKGKLKWLEEEFDRTGSTNKAQNLAASYVEKYSQ